MHFRKIHEGKADHAMTFELINRGYGPDVYRAGDWFETNGEDFWYFLECLPPMDMKDGAFSVCEFSTGYLTNAFVAIDGRFYCLTIERKSRADFDHAVAAFKTMAHAEAMA